MTEVFYGTKKVRAFPMNRKTYNDYRGWDQPENEDGDDEGYLIEHVGSGNANHDDHEDYITWTPKAVFLAEHEQATRMSFSHAMKALKDGDRIARQGWNGKGMFLFKVEGNAPKPGDPEPEAPDNTKGLAPAVEREIKTLDYVAMSTAQGDLVPWTCSQTDMLADDWTVVLA